MCIHVFRTPGIFFLSLVLTLRDNSEMWGGLNSQHEAPKKGLQSS